MMQQQPMMMQPGMVMMQPGMMMPGQVEPMKGVEIMTESLEPIMIKCWDCHHEGLTNVELKTGNF